MFQKFINRFVLNTKNNENRLNALVFDFITIGVVSLTVNALTSNNHSTPFYIQYLAIFGAALIGTHWHLENIFRDKYEKESFQFYIINYLMSFSLGLTGIAMSLLGNMSSQTPEVKKFWEWLGILLYVIGILATRILGVFQYLMAFLANPKLVHDRKLILHKIISRSVVVLATIIHLGLIIEDFEIELTIYIFLPIYFFSEKLGNILVVTFKKISGYESTIIYLKERYKRLTTIFLASLFISSMTRITYNLYTSQDVSNLTLFMLTFTLLFLIYHTYMKLVNYSEPIPNMNNLFKTSLLSTLIIISITAMGGFLINIGDADTNSNMSIILISSSLLLLSISLIFASMNKCAKVLLFRILIVNSLFIILLLVMGILSINVILIKPYYLYLILIATWSFAYLSDYLIIRYTKCEIPS